MLFGAFHVRPTGTKLEPRDIIIPCLSLPETENESAHAAPLQFQDDDDDD
jgi:hypothetical protein